ncbi:unnamed protein product [Closterium sp. Yama58-4]|nr:unnamed protein product [Closterium sp. Yama58-4]
MHVGGCATPLACTWGAVRRLSHARGGLCDASRMHVGGCATPLACTWVAVVSGLTCIAARNAFAAPTTLLQRLCSNDSVHDHMRLHASFASRLTPLLASPHCPLSQIPQARMCLPGALSRARVAGRMVLCEAGGTTPEAKAGEVRRAGGRAIVIASASATAGSVGAGYALDLPSLVVNRSMTQALRSFLNRSSNPHATLSSLSLQSNQVAPVMAPFSSTGPIVDPNLPPGHSPQGFTNDILKPDITGPGVNLLGPMASGKKGEAAYQLLSGTSMAVPHLVGIAALIMQKYPSWSPAAVKSAIMTTGTVWNNRNEPIRTSSGRRATPWNFGSGHVVAARAMDPGLVYNVGAKGYMAFLFGIDFGTAQKSFQQQQPQKGGGRTAIKAYDLNLPNICVSNLMGTVTVVRRVTNVARQASRYRARVVAPKNVRVVVAPAAFTIAPGASQVFSVTFTVVQATRAFSFGSLTWVDGTHRVRSVLAAQPVQA